MTELKKCQRLNCENLHNNAKFCSKQCSNLFFSTSNRSKCIVCGNLVEKKKNKHCQKCKPSRMTNLIEKTYADIAKERKYQKNSRVREIARNVFKNSNIAYICKSCGYDKHVEICHIKGISSFSQNAKISEINDTNNLVALCPNCHWELDHNILDLSFLDKPDVMREIEIKKRKAPRECMILKKIPMPSKEELGKLLWEISTTKIAKLFDVSDATIAKWAKKLGLSKPPVGYWAKLYAGLINK